MSNPVVVFGHVVLLAVNIVRASGRGMSKGVPALLFVVLCVNLLYHVTASQLRLPRLGLGTAGLREDTQEVVAAALSLGVRLIDTAQAKEWYDEQGVADAINSFPSLSPGPIVVTKIHPRSYSLAAMRTALAQSSRIFDNIGLHVVLLHAPFCWEGQCTLAQSRVNWKMAWKNLETLQEDFAIGMIGVSNFDENQLHELLTSIATKRVSVIQNWMDPFHQDLAVRRIAAENDMQYMAYSSFGTQWHNQPTNPVFDSPVLTNIAEHHECSVARVVLAWLLAEGVIAIPRTANMNHIDDNFGVCQGDNNALCNSSPPSHVDTFLTPDEIDSIRALDGSIGTPWD